MKYSNKHNLPLSVAVWLATDWYDHQVEPNAISVTTLMKSTREVILTNRLGEGDAVQDVSALLASRSGTAIHDALEKAWLNPNLKDVLISLGYPEKVHSRIHINPEAPTGELDIYLEKRTNKRLGKWIISGQMDLCINGQLTDLKNTSTYTYVAKTNDDKYIEQLSIYAWLNPDIVLDEYGKILFIFKDWNKNYALAGKGYPTHPIIEEPFLLMEPADTERILQVKLNRLDMYWNKPMHEIPECTPDELWQAPPTYKYYSKFGAIKASKVSTDFNEMQQHLRDKGVGFIKEVKAEPVKCRFCPAANTCDQAARYVNDGILNLN